MKTPILTLLLLTAMASSASAETVDASKKAPRQRWHAPTVLAQIGTGSLVGMLSVVPYLGIAEGVDSLTNSGGHHYSDGGLAFAATVVPVLAPTTIWATGKLLRGTGSALWTILLGWATGAAVGATVQLVDGEIVHGWFAGEIAAIAVSIPVYHLTSDRRSVDSMNSLYIGPGPGKGLVIGGRF